MTGGLILVGGGGHCRSCIEVLEMAGRRIAGIVDGPGKAGAGILGHRVIGADGDLPRLAGEGAEFLVTLGQIGAPGRRRELFDHLKSLGARLATVVSPLAHVSPSARLGEGTIVMHHALVIAGASVGANCIVNSKALVEHDAAVGDHSHVSTAAVINGAASVGVGSFVGSGAVVAQMARVPAGCVIGAGTVVHKSIPEAGVYVGNPYRKLREA